MIAPLTSEDMLIIAEEVCEEYGTSIRSAAALCAVAAVARGQIGGIPVHRDAHECTEAITDAITRLAPLREHNDVLAAVTIAAVHKRG
ncbi:TetR family transcriptional regulator [Corynebacterium sp. TAE3-ERU12]|uniref:TetR family transcriptional regulator n=1 Tax=Corynebacterium sp. TAE3-ERU12 TaxID=2849491 RepID=UPI001C440221|nr:TetR family transcriptional regulator [Corynebacterium sp. TAE3-ERU12]MBV7294353.1 TetR family transcriptional regulator [Corynebacterium sp. TAE3-ERU12]